MIHLLGNLPSSIVENGLPSTMHYYEKFFFSTFLPCRFREVKHEASVLAKTSSLVGMAGQLLSRVVVSVVGTQGLDENDPLFKLEKADQFLLEYVPLSFLRFNE